MKNNILKKENLILLAFLAQLVFLLAFNLTQTKYMVNMDSSEYLVQVMQIARQGTLLIDHYAYSTALMWDMPTLLAVPFYAITGNIFLSWGIAVDLYLVLFAVILRKLTKDLKLSDGVSYAVLLATFTLYAHGLVDYADMLLINGATYLVRIILLMTLLDVSVSLETNCRTEGHKIGWPEKLEILLLTIGLFICGISTGIFAAGCIIAPVLVCEFLQMILHNEKMNIRQEKAFCFALLMTMVSMLGVVTNKLLDLPSSQESSKYLTAAADLADRAWNNLAGILSLFGWPDAGVALLSAEGILALCGAAVALGLTMAFFAALHLVRKKTLCAQQTAYVWMTVSAFAVNYLLFTLVDLSYGGGSCEYRYWLLVMIPAMPVGGIVLDQLERMHSGLFHKFVFSLAVLILLLINVYKDKDLLDYAKSGKTYAAVNAAAMELASENDVDVLYLYTDYYWGRQLATYASKDMEVMAVADDTEDGLGNWTYGKLTMPQWGTYVRYDGSSAENTAETCGKQVAVLVDMKSANQREYLESKATAMIALDDVKGAGKLDDRFELLLFPEGENPMDFTGAND